MNTPNGTKRYCRESNSRIQGYRRIFVIWPFATQLQTNSIWLVNVFLSALLSIYSTILLETHFLENEIGRNLTDVNNRKTAIDWNLIFHRVLTFLLGAKI